MTKAWYLRWTAVIVVLLMGMSLCSLFPTMKAEALAAQRPYYNTSYTLTGNGATDIVAVAQKQNGKTESDLNYDGRAWCAYFVSDCAILAGQSAAIPENGSCTSMKKAVLNAGGKEVSQANAQIGDLVFYDWESDGGINHVGIVYKVSSGSIYTIDGNTEMDDGGYGVTQHKAYYIHSIVRPAYKSNATLSSISVTTVPNTTIYEDGSAFNTAGMVVTAKYSDGSSKAVTGYTTSVDLSTTGTKNVTISYTESGVTKTTTQSVTVQDLFEGSGTSSDPYKIGTASDLQAVADNVNNISANGCYGYAYYIQTADIDLSGIEWIPIGVFYESADSATTTSRAAFNGHYNGNFKKITALNVNNSRNFSGLFGRTYGNTVIENLSVSGSVVGSAACVGGIIGEFGYGGKILNCDFSGTVTGGSLTGGIVGKVQGGGTISYCYANANITATREDGYAGGLIGYSLVGNNNSSVNMLCDGCYFAGTVTGTFSGGVCGESVIQTTKECTASFDNTYYLNTASSGAVAGASHTGCSELSESSLKASAELLGEVYTDAVDGQNDGYPVFIWQAGAPFAGSGTESDPYQISSKEELKKMRDLVNNTTLNSIYGYAYYIQTADIDLENANWIPIGSYYENDTSTTTTSKAAFNGNYNGNQHTITGLNVNTTRDYGGLFGRANNSGKIYDLAVEGNVAADGNFTGGVIGAVCWGAKVTGCSFNGTVTAVYNVGGITGIVHQGGFIENCYANAEITATDATYGYAGGIAGLLRTGSGDKTCTAVNVINCYFTGKTNGAARNGGITCGVEQLDGTYQPELSLTNCYSSSTSSTGAVNDGSYAGCTVLSENLLKHAAADLGTPFADNTDPNLNNGYPVFYWQLNSKGDVNIDQSVSVTDVIALTKHILTLHALDAQQCENADMDENGIVNAFDLAILKSTILQN